MPTTLDLVPNRSWISWQGLPCRVTANNASRDGMREITLMRYTRDGRKISAQTMHVSPRAIWQLTARPQRRPATV